MWAILDRLFFEHPRSNGESYGQHFLEAFKLWIKMLGALAALGVHIFIPGFFQTTASCLIKKCHKDLGDRGLVTDLKVLKESTELQESQEVTVLKESQETKGPEEPKRI